MRTEAHPSAVLRAARSSDLAAVEMLLTENSLPLDGVADSLSSFVVAEYEDALVGVVGIEYSATGTDALLRSVAVSDDWKGKGLGRALVTRAIQDAESQGAQALYLLTTTAEHYFPSFGFRSVTRDAVPASIKASVEFASACPASAVVMVRNSA